jgi:hypothetical protein
MSGILKLAVLSTIDNLDRRMFRRVKLVKHLKLLLNILKFLLAPQYHHEGTKVPAGMRLAIPAVRRKH